MSGKVIFLGLQYVGDDLIENAEYGSFPVQAGPRVRIENEMAQNWHTSADDTEMKVWYDT